MASKIMKRVFSFSIFAFLIFLPLSVFGAGASLYLSPSAGTFFVGSTFDVSVFLNTGLNDVNAIQADIKFDSEKLQVASPSAGKSFIEVWVSQPTYSNTKGEMTFIGGIPTPGINTSSGLISTVTFRAVAPGEAKIYFLPSSQVMKNDPQGTNILTSTSRGVYTLIIPPPEGPKVFSLTHPDSNKWYKNNNPTFSWEKEEGVTDFSYSLDQDATLVPDSESEGGHTSVSFSQVKDGIWYFHIKAKKDGVWGGASHYLVQIDSTVPAAFTPISAPSARTTENQPLISFITTDALSGIDYYQIKYINITSGVEEESMFFVEAVSPYKLPALNIGKYLVVVRAYDLAGNFREGIVKIQILPKGIVFTKSGVQYRGVSFPWRALILILLIILLFALFYFLKRHRGLIKREREKLDGMTERLDEDKEKRMIEEIRRRALKRHREVLEKMKLGKKELEKRLPELLKKKKDLELQKSQFSEKKAQIEQNLNEIIEKETLVEEEGKAIEEKERLVGLPEEKKKIEKMRWEIEDRRKEIEKERWSIEEEKNKIEPQLKEINLKYQKATEEESDLEEKITGLDWEMGIKLERKEKKVGEMEREAKGKEINRQKEILVQHKFKKEEFEERFPELLEKKKTLELEKSQLSEKERRLFQILDEIEKKKIQIDIVENEKKTLEEKSKLSREKRNIEKMKREMEEKRKEIEKERWRLEEEKNKIESQIKEID